MREYIEGTGSDAILCIPPPRRLKINPIEMPWRELKKAISGT